MGLFRKHTSPENTPLTIDDALATPHGERILSSVERLDLDPEQTIIAGSAALALYGVELADGPFVDAQDSRARPGDVDLASTAGQFLELAETMRTPSGIILTEKDLAAGGKQIILRADAPEDMLPVDIITRYDHDRGIIASFDKRFQRYFAKRSQRIVGAPELPRIITPAAIRSEIIDSNPPVMKSEGTRPYADLQALDDHLRQQRAPQ